MGKQAKSPEQNFTGSPPSGVTVTLPSSNKQVSLSSYVQSKELVSEVQIGQFLIPSSLTVLSGQGEVTDIDKR